MKPEFLNDISSIAHKYELFIVDINGVISDGVSLYPQALDSISALVDAERSVLFLSNVPRPSEAIARKFELLGAKLSNINIVTSGDFFLHELAQDIKSSKKKRHAYLVGAERNKDLSLEGFCLPVGRPEDADCLIILGFIEDDEPGRRYDEILQIASEQKIPALCPNPDEFALNGARLRYPSGAIAKRYEAMGGKVRYYGKPYHAIYEFALNGYQHDKSKILAIGDSIYTDILGANMLGIDSLLISKGIHRDEELDTVLNKCIASPNYICDALRMRE